MKNILFFFLTAFSSLGFYQADAYKGCEDKRMTELCLTKTVENCYTCVNTEPTKFIRPPVCVPIFHHNLGTLENYPSNKWNCTVYRPDVKEDQNENNILKEICPIDNFITELCNDTDKNGFCMIASYIHDICNADEASNSNSKEVSLESILYESPWGPLSDCNQYFYKEICTNEAAKFCFDCRKFLGKDFFTKNPRYSYYCSPFYKDMNEKESVDWFTKEKYECKRWINPNYKPSSSIQLENIESNNENSLSQINTENGYYPACSGPICQKEGWSWYKTAYGKVWCGQGSCKPFGRTMFVCSYPTNCGKKLDSIEHEDLMEHEFRSMSCGKEKFNCLLRKECRKLIKKLDDCNEDFSCLYQLVSTSENEQFIKLANCILQ